MRKWKCLVLTRGADDGLELSLRQHGYSHPQDLVKAWYNDLLPPGSPSAALYPFAYKIYALKYGLEALADTVLWVDSDLRAVSSLEPLLDETSRTGGFFIRTGKMCEGNSKMLPALGLVDRDVGQIPEVTSAVFGLDMRSVEALRFIVDALKPTLDGTLANASVEDFDFFISHFARKYGFIAKEPSVFDLYFKRPLHEID